MYALHMTIKVNRDHEITYAVVITPLNCVVDLMLSSRYALSKLIFDTKSTQF